MTTLKAQVKWEEAVQAQYDDGISFLREMSVTDRPNARFKEALLTSLLSDVQELIDMDDMHKDTAIEMVNRIKFMLNCCH